MPGLPAACLMVLAFGPIDVSANAPPAVPVITEPSGTRALQPSDVHMEIDAFSDPDALDSHGCTNWEIWAITPDEKVWETPCIGGVERLHTHFGDGTFLGSHGDLHALLGDREYKLRVRVKDNSADAVTQWSPWSERPFVTVSAAGVHPLLVSDVGASPVPAWKNETNADILLGASSPPPQLLLESPAGGLMLMLTGHNSSGNLLTNPASLTSAAPARVVLKAGASALSLPPSQLRFTAGDGSDHVIYLPEVALVPGMDTAFWISANGSSYAGTTAQSEPDFSKLARAAHLPWTMKQPGYKVELVSSGFELPVNIAFVPNPGTHGDSPLFYVTELYGSIKMVTRDGAMGDYAANLLNFGPSGIFPGSGELGLSGIVVDQGTGDVFAAMMYMHSSGATYPKVVRFHSMDGGRTAAAQTTILDMVGEVQGQSHFISNLSIGPDGKLYVHMGDGFSANTAQNLESFRGKVLRINLDGTAPTNNPFYSAANGITARDFVFAYGLRNPFGGDWRDADGSHYTVEVGPSVDRMSKTVSGRNYLWDGSDASMRNHAIYAWEPGPAPVNIAFVQPSRFGGSGFPADKIGRAYVTESGPTWATGLPTIGKRITEWAYTPTGELQQGPEDFLEYSGSGKASLSAIAAGPDGLYFADLYKDLEGGAPSDRGANVYRIRYVGKADFSADMTQGAVAPFTVRFTDLSDIPGVDHWHWEFGDGAISHDRNPVHTFTTTGLHNVRLTVESPAGPTGVQKNAYIAIGVASGLTAEYFSDANLGALAMTRVDATVDFNWEGGSPAASVPADGFSVRWSGSVRPAFGQNYTFYTTTDDGVRLWVDGQLLINNWTHHPPTEDSGSISLTAGQSYAIRLEYYENGGGAMASLSWASASQPKQIIPRARFSVQAEGPVNSNPTVTLVQPIGGAVYVAQSPVALSAEAVDSDGSIARVDFFADGVLIGSSATPSSPDTYAASWNGAAVGTHSISAQAVDNAGGLTNSAAAVITVNPDPNGGGTALPSPWIGADVGAVEIAGASTHSGGVFTVEASGSDVWNDKDAFHSVY